MGLLKIGKEFCGNVECLTQCLRHFWANSSLPVQNRIDGLFRDSQDERQITLRPTALFHFLFNVVARMLYPTLRHSSHVSS